MNACDEGYSESRMRENRTYGLMRGRVSLLSHSLYSTGRLLPFLDLGNVHSQLIDFTCDFGELGFQSTLLTDQ